MAIYKDWKIISQKELKKKEKIEKEISNIWKEIWWINWDLDLYEWIIEEELLEDYKVFWFNRNIRKNPNKEKESILINKNKINYA